MLKILVVDDELQNRESIAEIFSRLGCQCDVATDGLNALNQVSKVTYDLVLSDLRMPKMDGAVFFEAWRQSHSSKSTLFAFMTAYGQMDEAVDLMRRGAIHFLSKPLRKKELVGLLEEVRKISIAKVHYPKNKKINGPVFKSAKFEKLIDLTQRVAMSNTSVLIQGESGTGKEILAQYLHSLSARAKGPFVAVNAAALPDNLLESELFGHEKGAFTGAEFSRVGQIRSAHGGTFFLDELGSMSLTVQSKLLRVIQEKQVQPLGSNQPVSVDVRWVAASNTSLDSLVARGQFRADLLFRLKVVTIEIPPLRERIEDIEPLTNYFLGELEKVIGKSLQVTSEVSELLLQYPWPGNVRELRNVLERGAALSDSGVIDVTLLPTHIRGYEAETFREVRIPLGMTLESAEDRIIEETLRFCQGDKAAAAGVLGVNLRTIYRWLEKHNPRQ